MGGIPLEFTVNEKDFRLRVVYRTKSQVFLCLRRLPLLSKENSSIEIFASPPSPFRHPLEQSIIYECQEFIACCSSFQRGTNSGRRESIWVNTGRQ